MFEGFFKEDPSMAAGQHCLSLSAHTHIKRRHAHTYLGKMPGMEPFRHVPLCWWFLCVCVCARGQMGVRPVVSVPCQHQQPRCTVVASLCSVQAPCLASTAGHTHTHTGSLHDAHTRPCCSSSCFASVPDQTRTLHTASPQTLALPAFLIATSTQLFTRSPCVCGCVCV